jgi:hypothetical protein
MQSREIVERHSGVHMVFHMVVHVPVEELHERVNLHRPGTLSPIGNAGTESDMLGKGTQSGQPWGDEAADVHH